MGALILLHQRRAHAAALELGGVQENKQILGIGNAHTAVINDHNDV